VSDDRLITLGAGLPAQAQLSAHAERMRGRCFGNPHSENPTSATSTELIERTRRAVLAHFNAPPEEYAAVFTPNATGACRLVGESYPFGPRTRLVLTYDNHNSVNGIREFARSHAGKAVRRSRRWRHQRSRVPSRRAARDLGGGRHQLPSPQT